MIIHFLGTGAAVNSPYLRTSVVLEQKTTNRHVLVDASPECSALLRRHGLTPHNIDVVLLTHLHGDHMLGLPLLLAEFFVSPNDRPLRIIGPRDTERVVRALLQLSYPDTDPSVFLEKANATFEIVTLRSEIVVAELRVRAVAASHGAIEAYGFHVEAPDLTLYISGDTSLTATVQAAVAAADFSIVDATTIDASLKTHMNLRDVFQLISACRRDQYVFAAHRTFPDPGNGPQNLIFPMDGRSYRLYRGGAPDEHQP
jgi:ribonuclease BN (tRNA processing enzyme)